MNELRVRAMLAEHQGLRSEIVALVGRQSAIAYWAASSGVVLVAAVLASWGSIANVPYALPLVFCLVFPLAATGYVIAWFWIGITLANLGAYVYLLERKVAAALPARRRFTDGETGGSPAGQLARRLAKDPMGWEHYLQFNPDEPGELKHAFIPVAEKTARSVTAVVYLVANVLGGWLLAGQLRAMKPHPSVTHIVVVVAAPFVVWLAVWLLFNRSANREFGRARARVQAFDALREEDFGEG